MVTKDEILAAIKREAAANGGVPLGEKRFALAAGIPTHIWKGRYWARWSEALREAGLETRAWGPVGSLSDDALATILADLTRELGRFPTDPELRLRRRSDPSVPHAAVYRDRFGSVDAQRARVFDFAAAHDGYGDVAALLQPSLIRERPAAKRNDAPLVAGSVYLFKSGEFHKVGRSNSVGRRAYEVGLQLPERVEVIHEIETDDPEGIEAYWHRRFAARRANGEWFRLTADDLVAFKRRCYV